MLHKMVLKAQSGNRFFFFLLSSPVLVTITRAGVCKTDALVQVCHRREAETDRSAHYRGPGARALCGAEGERQSCWGAAHTKAASVHTRAATWDHGALATRAGAGADAVRRRGWMSPGAGEVAGSLPLPRVAAGLSPVVGLLRSPAQPQLLMVTIHPL